MVMQSQSRRTNGTSKSLTRQTGKQSVSRSSQRYVARLYAVVRPQVRPQTSNVEAKVGTLCPELSSIFGASTRRLHALRSHSRSVEHIFHIALDVVASLSIVYRISRRVVDRTTPGSIVEAPTEKPPPQDPREAHRRRLSHSRVTIPTHTFIYMV